MAETGMVEKVARAVWDKENPTVSWVLVPRWMADEYRKRARWYIEAMREPTEAMCEAGADYLDTNDPADTSPSARQMGSAWQAMIDAILKDGDSA